MIARPRRFGKTLNMSMLVMEKQLQKDVFHTAFDEQVVFDQLGQGDDAVWSLLLVSGYLKAEHAEFDQTSGKTNYTLKLTNREVYIMFQQMVESWSKGCRPRQSGYGNMGPLLKGKKYRSAINSLRILPHKHDKQATGSPIVFDEDREGLSQNSPFSSRPGQTTARTGHAVLMP